MKAIIADQYKEYKRTHTNPVGYSTFHRRYEKYWLKKALLMWNSLGRWWARTTVRYKDCWRAMTKEWLFNYTYNAFTRLVRWLNAKSKMSNAVIEYYKNYINK